MEDNNKDTSNKSEDKKSVYVDDILDDELDTEKELKDDEISLEDMVLNEESISNITDIINKPVAQLYLIDTIYAKLEVLRSTLSKTEIEEQSIDKDSQLNALRRMAIEESAAINQYVRNKLMAVDDTLETKYISDEMTIMDRSPVSNKSRHGKMISGKEAELLVQAKNRNFKQIYLFNSGIWITIQCPTVSDLNIYYNAVSSTTQEYGREFGAYFYMFSDSVIKSATVDLIKTLTIDSNIKNWDRNDNLIKSISILDYDVILWGISALMFKTGYPYIFTCANTNPVCTYTETADIDIIETRWNNYHIIPKKCLEFIHEKKKRTLTELVQYRKMLGFSKIVDLYSTWKVKTKVPTIYEFLRYADKYNNALYENVTISDEDQLLRYIKFNYYSISSF